MSAWLVGDAPGWLAPAAAVALAAFIVLIFGAALFSCGDTGWHLTAGDWIIAHRQVPHVDHFSLTFAGKPWVAHEWLAEVVMAAAFAMGSWSALGLMFAGVVAAVLFVMGQTIGHHLPPKAVLITLALVTAVLATTVLARPHVFGWLLLAVWTTVLIKAREADRAPPLALALLMLVWANTHASFLFGMILAGALGLEALMARPQLDVFRGWLLFGLVALIMALATPHGIDGLLFPLQVSGMRTVSLIGEWTPTNFAEQPAFGVLLAAGLYLIVKHRVRVPLIRMLIVIVTLVMALQHARHQAIFAIIVPMLLAAPIAVATATDKPARRQTWPLIVALFACAGLAAAARIAAPAVEQDGVNNPVATLDQLPSSLTSRPVLNGYAFGGALIQRGIPAFIDGRADMYGDDFMETYARIDGGDMAAFRKAVQRYGIGWTILPPTSRLVAALDREPGWRRLRSDENAIVHVRELR